MEIEPILITAIIFGFAYATIQLLVRRKERMAMLEKGTDASFFLSPAKKQSYLALKIGLLSIGIAVGIICGGLLYHLARIEQEVAYFSMIFLFGGVGLVVNHFIEKNERKENGE